MRQRRVLAGLGLALALLAPGTASAQEAQEAPASPAPVSLDQLLERVRAGWRRERADNQKREAGFLARKQEQQRLLSEATAERERLEKRSEELETRFQQGELEVAKLEAQLGERLGDLGELFGVVRQVAGDTRAHVEASLVSAQFPDREAAIAELSESRRLPSISQLEELWHQLLLEAGESGKVVRFEAPVIEPDGSESTREVVRVGVFNAVSGGRYLAWNEKLGRLSVIARQPPGRYRSTVDDLEAATEGPVRFAVDPSRGAILSMLVETPNLRERIGFGGGIGYAILVLGGLTVVFALFRLVAVLVASRRVADQKRAAENGDGQPDPGNPLGRVISVFDANRSTDTETLELKLDEAVLRESSKLERGLWLIKVMSVLAPLGGLLGTVTGMIQTFQAITQFGTGDPKLMAGGISEALVTTMLGLFVAIPLVLLHSWVASLTRGVTDVLDEQSAGLVARQAEARSGDSG
ncbi:MAG: MotA/TolQ/ExbB proton channel family protein [Myxococcota bacterium]